MKKTKLLLAGLMYGFNILNPCFANNISITGGSGSGSDLSFTISWDNSWYASSSPNNWDAVWVFVKYKDCSTANWIHADLDPTPGNHTIAGGSGNLQVDLDTRDNKGVFIRRTAAGGPGTVSGDVTLRLTVATGSYNFKVYGIEMVKVLNEDFQISDGAATDRFSSITITSENAVATGGAGSVATLPAAYPKGWNAFYAMKYEVTQEQYVDFLNTLTYDQQANRVATSPDIMATNWAMGPNAATVGRSRNGVKVKTSGVASTTPAEYACDLGTNAADGVPNNTYNELYDGQNVACNYISWADLVAYLDWACLRPMTDLEFEKIGRGTISRVANEYAWGSVALTQTQNYSTSGNTFSNSASERASDGTNAIETGNGLCAYGMLAGCNTAISMANAGNRNNGPLRVGFAATNITDRILAGASYYGSLDMSGNLVERIVATNAAGSTFTGTLGDGTLDANGNATNTTDSGGDWPAYSTASGSGSRGGDWYNITTGYLQTSDRSFATTSNTTRICNYGGRGVR